MTDRELAVHDKGHSQVRLLHSGYRCVRANHLLLVWHCLGQLQLLILQEGVRKEAIRVLCNLFIDRVLVAVGHQRMKRLAELMELWQEACVRACVCVASRSTHTAPSVRLFVRVCVRPSVRVPMHPSPMLSV